MIDDQSLTKLVIQAQAGDKDAFEKLFRIYERKIYTYLERLVSHNDQWREDVFPGLGKATGIA